MTDAHCHVSGGDPSVREFLIGREFVGLHPWDVKPEGIVNHGLPRINTDCGHASQSVPIRVHPWLSKIEGRLREQLAANPRLGVGEIGLDRLKSRDISPQMRAVFEAQLRVALELGRPVVLHGAKCWGQVVKTLQTSQTLQTFQTFQTFQTSQTFQTFQTSQTFQTAQTPQTFLFHGFSRSDGLLPDIVALNGYVSVGPAVLNDHAVNYRALVKKIPLDRLLVETDRDCDPASLLNPLTGAPLSVRDVLAKTAELRGLSPAELEAITDANAMRFWGVAQT